MGKSNDDRSRSMNLQDSVGKSAAANHEAQVVSNINSNLSSEDDSED